ncbi:hypothetical protein D3C85_1814930 [compost metagenome]
MISAPLAAWTILSPCGMFLMAAVSMRVRGQSELTRIPSAFSSSARPRVVRLIPYFAMV